MHATALTAQPFCSRDSLLRSATGGKRGDVVTRWERGVVIHTYIRRAPLAGNVDGGVLRARG